MKPPYLMSRPTISSNFSETFPETPFEYCIIEFLPLGELIHVHASLMSRELASPFSSTIQTTSGSYDSSESDKTDFDLGAAYIC